VSAAVKNTGVRYKSVISIFELSLKPGNKFSKPLDGFYQDKNR
jgi:hypothetical protein